MSAFDAWNVEINILAHETEMISLPAEFHFDNAISIFFRNHVEKDARRLAPNLFPFFKKAVYKVKVVTTLVYFSWHRLEHQ